MINSENKFKNRESGFTLIEMFIVIAVIGILSGVVFRGTAGIQKSARDTRRISDIRSGQNYLELYFNKCGHYPGTLTGGGSCTKDLSLSISNKSDWDKLATAMKDLDIISDQSNFPKDPTKGFYFYTSSGPDHLDYVLGAQLETRNQVLENDVDGPATAGGISCNDSDPLSLMYCVRP
jgi:prepilin-type N-terminal cleavage/methylation domain-containing protein